MHKKLAADLTSLAHSILRIKNKDDVLLLKEKAHELYEKLSVLAYVEEYINTTPNAEFTKEELVEKIARIEEKKEIVKEQQPVVYEEEFIVDEVPITPETVQEEIIETEQQQEIELIVEETIEDSIEFSTGEESVLEINNNIVLEEPKLEDDAIDITNDIVEEDVIEIRTEEVDKEIEIIEQPFDELQELLFKDDTNKDDAKDIGEQKTRTLEDELQDTISVDVAANLFQKAPLETPKKNTDLAMIQIGLNDRIAFVKHLFDGNQADFNRVISQLNTVKTEKDAKTFIKKIVKLDYDWKGKEAYETRFIEIIEKRFL